MAGTTIYRSDFPIFMQPAKLQVAITEFWEGFELPEMRKDYFNVMSTDNPFEMYMGMVGLGNATRKKEGVLPAFDAPQMGRPYTVVFPTYALATAISKEAQSDDKKNQLVPMILKELKKSMVYTMEQDAADQWNDSFTYQGWEPDGTALFSSLHPVLRQQASSPAYWSNMHPTDAALSITSLDAAYTSLRLTLNDSGRWMDELVPKTLEVHPSLEPYAQQIVGTAKVLGNNYNDKNLYYGKLEVRSNPRFTRQNQWFLSCERHEWVWYDRQSADIITEIDRIAGATTFVTSARWGRGARSGRGKYGSRGPS